MKDKCGAPNEVITDGDITRIRLKNSELWVIIDTQDLPLVSDYIWYQLRSKYTTYARASKLGKHSLMHRVITGVGEGLEVDHDNGNGLDNRRSSNLAVVNHSANMWKRVRRKDTFKSPYQGVRLIRQSAWIAEIRQYGKRKYLGTFPTPEKARDKYLEACAKRN